MRFAAVLLVVGSLFGSNPSSRELLGNDSPAESAGASEQATVPDVIYIDPVDYVPESLRRPITITIDPMPLDAACRRISDLTGIRFMFDKSSLSDQGISPEEDVEARAHGEPVYLLLDRLFENVAGVQLDWIAAADGLEVLSKDDCEWRRSIKSYPIGDLLDGSSPDDVIEVVRSMTGRHWEHRWKPIDDDDRQIAVFGNTLIVRQSDRCHREIDMLLDALRKPGRERRVGEPALHATLLADLQQKCTLMALGTPLSLAVQQLNSDYGLGIWIDERALNYEGISSDEEVVAIAQQLTIDSALKRMLQNVAGVELDTIAQYGQLRVTTLARADKLPRTVIFDVSDICGQSREQVAALIVALSASVGATGARMRLPST